MQLFFKKYFDKLFTRRELFRQGHSAGSEVPAASAVDSAVPFSDGSAADTILSFAEGLFGFFRFIVTFACSYWRTSAQTANLLSISAIPPSWSVILSPQSTLMSNLSVRSTRVIPVIPQCSAFSRI